VCGKCFFFFSVFFLFFYSFLLLYSEKSLEISCVRIRYRTISTGTGTCLGTFGPRHRFTQTTVADSDLVDP
jgi:hypothetical protein